MKQGKVVWLTGLPCSGKSTIARALIVELGRARGYDTHLLDGDEMRNTPICSGLGFTRDDRDMNVRRLGFIAGLLAEHGVIAVVASVSPYRDTRKELVKHAAAMGTHFIEVHVDAPVEVCSARDVKGMYAAARAGTIKHFTGHDDPYESPLAPDVRLYTSESSVADCVAQLLPLVTRTW
jgi:adenylylsulfate kinase